MGELFTKIAVLPLQKRAFTGAPGARVTTLSRFPAFSANTTIGTSPAFVPRTTKAPACSPPSRKVWPGAIEVLLVRDAQAGKNELTRRSTSARAFEWRVMGCGGRREDGGDTVKYLP